MSKPSARGPQPLSGSEFSECLDVMENPDRYNRRSRRAARSRLRKHAKYIRKHVDEKDRTPVQTSFLRIAASL